MQKRKSTRLLLLEHQVKLGQKWVFSRQINLTIPLQKSQAKHDRQHQKQLLGELSADLDYLEVLASEIRDNMIMEFYKLGIIPYFY